MTLSIQDTQQNNIQHIDNQHNGLNCDTQHNDIQYNDISHNELNCDTQHIRHSAKQHSA